MGKESRHTRRSKRPASSPSSAVAKEKVLAGGLSLVTQQRCLDIFHSALWLSQHDLDAVQEVKGHLYNRDFLTAFSRPEYLRAYALRWSASRSLCYGSIFSSLDRHISLSSLAERDQDAAATELKVVCVGGGAGAELVGLAAWLHTSEVVDSRAFAVNAQLVDIADWSQVTSSLYENIVTPPELSKYASAAARDRNTALVSSDRLAATFTRADVLDADGPPDLSQAMATSHLITIMFTLNELYSTSIPKTQALLRDLTARAQPNTLLLIVDSPGSYSTVTLNGNEKRYPMVWLLDYTLLGRQGESSESAPWDRLWSEESTWFRLPEGLQYPVDLENMRYQSHLYRRRAD